MHQFYFYFIMGLQHITDLNGLDHFLFIAALCLRYQYHDWKQLVVLITAFTIGHSVTLALSTYNIINLAAQSTEFLIAATILITAISNLFVKKFHPTSGYNLIYLMALLFGLVHGMGFSSILQSMLGPSQDIIIPLLAFNIGLEAGQVMIVAFLLLLSFIFVTLLAINRKDYLIFLTGAISALALEMMTERMFF